MLGRRSFVLLTLAGCTRGPGTPSAATTATRRSPLPPPRSPEPAAAADDPDPLQAHVARLKARWADEGYVVLAEPPFVVIGDESPERVQGHAEGTVRWATERLREFFPADPAETIEVWLFADERSYRRGAAAIFGDDPDTPYGYYAPSHRALVMNIGSGGGTLVHEMVHPLMATNFPACPTWFNEGLASLYEQCGDRGGEIWGFPNWRLPGLQEAIADDRVPTFETLLSTTESAFYGEDPGTNYVQARYPCLWLQEEGKLRPFFHDFVAEAADDPTGLATLRRHVGGDLAAFQRRWSRWVTALRWS